MPVDPRIQAALDAPLNRRSNTPRLTPKQGYAAPPGTGPFGETCGSCRHLHTAGNPRKDLHCNLAGHRRGERRPSQGSPACSRWEPTCREGRDG